MIKALIFDLDDTLYLESDFVASGYRAVARHLTENYGCNYQDVFYAMMATFATRGRESVLPMAIARFLNGSVPLNELVEVYREHWPTIRLLPGYSDLLKKLGQTYRLGIITDGLPEVQKRKVSALKLDSLMDKVLYTWEYGPEMEKPHPLSFALMTEYLNTAPENALFIGDSPDKDCRGAHAAGMKSVCLQAVPQNGNFHKQAAEENPDFVIDSLYQLPRILESDRL